MLWLKKVWEWLKDWWSLLILVLGGLLWFLLRRDGSGPLLPSQGSEVEGAEETRTEAESEAKKSEEEAKETREAHLKQIHDEYSSVIEKLDEKQAEQYEELKADPDRLNEFLLNVDRSIGGEP